MQPKILALSLSAALIGALFALPTPSLAAKKTAKMCEDEWTALVNAKQTAGKTKTAFISTCETQDQPAATNAATTPATTTSPPTNAAL